MQLNHILAVINEYKFNEFEMHSASGHDGVDDSDDGRHCLNAANMMRGN